MDGWKNPIEDERGVDISQIHRQLNLTVPERVSEMVHAAKFTFNPVYGKKYYLYQDEAIGKYRLVQNSPQEWSCGIPLGWSFCQVVRKLGDSTWEIIEEEAQ